MVFAPELSMFSVMKPIRNQMLYWVGALTLLYVAEMARAEVKPNPYQPIIERNAFGLKPPPPPPDPTPPAPPAAPPAKVTLTGITSMFGPSSTRALLEIVEQEAGKAATPKKPILREGERLGSVEVVSIDVEKSVVKIRNGGIETNLTFEVVKSTSPAPGAPVTYPAPLNPGASPIPAFNPAAAAHPAGAPTIISPGASYDSSGRGSGVTIVGGGNSPSPTTGIQPPNALGTAAPGGSNPYGVGGYGAVPGSTFVPQRPVRTDNSATAAPQAMTADQAALLQRLHNEINQGKGFPPIPTTSPNK
jgi:hypothetical protein